MLFSLISPIQHYPGLSELCQPTILELLSLSLTRGDDSLPAKCDRTPSSYLQHADPPLRQHTGLDLRDLFCWLVENSVSSNGSTTKTLTLPPRELHYSLPHRGEACSRPLQHLHSTRNGIRSSSSSRADRLAFESTRHTLSTAAIAAMCPWNSLILQLPAS